MSEIERLKRLMNELSGNTEDERLAIQIYQSAISKLERKK